MRRSFVALSIACLTAFSVGCSNPPAPDPESSATNAETPTGGEDDAEIKQALAELPEADRAEAEAQRFCAIERENRLGSMGKPVKLVIDGRPVFVCCAGCEDAAKANPEKTLASVDELKKTR